MTKAISIEHVLQNEYKPYFFSDVIPEPIAVFSIKRNHPLKSCLLIQKSFARTMKTNQSSFCSKWLNLMTESFLDVNEMRVFNSFVLNTHWGRKIEWICLKDFKSLFLQKNSQWSSRMNRMRINVYHFKLMREVGWLSCKWRSSWQFALFQRWTDIDLKK